MWKLMKLTETDFFVWNFADFDPTTPRNLYIFVFYTPKATTLAYSKDGNTVFEVWFHALMSYESISKHVIKANWICCFVCLTHDCAQKTWILTCKPSLLWPCNRTKISKLSKACFPTDVQNCRMHIVISHEWDFQGSIRVFCELLQSWDIQEL